MFLRYRQLALQALWDFTAATNNEDRPRVGTESSPAADADLGSQQGSYSLDNDDDDSRDSSPGGGEANEVSTEPAGAMSRCLTMKLRPQKKEADRRYVYFLHVCGVCVGR